jgi:ABC-2 type transport system permease protein
MSAASELPTAPGAGAAFAALMRRDLRVMRPRAAVPARAHAAATAALHLRLRRAAAAHGLRARRLRAALLPGILAVSLALSAVQSVALPLVQDFGATREIEDRLLAPIPTTLLAAQKVAAGALQGIVAGLVVLPVARLLLGPVAGLGFGNVGAVLAVTGLGALTFSALGLWVGSAISPAQIGFMFSFIVSPLLIFGCAYYPVARARRDAGAAGGRAGQPAHLRERGDARRRGAGAPAPAAPIALGALSVLAVTFWALGLRSFRRRAFD